MSIKGVVLLRWYCVHGWRPLLDIDRGWKIVEPDLQQHGMGDEQDHRRIGYMREFRGEISERLVSRMYRQNAMYTCRVSSF
jgi:hypothetical protein